MFEKKLQKLKLSESIGYTFKCLGAGFWAFKQKDFRDAIQQVTMEVAQLFYASMPFKYEYYYSKWY